MRKLERDKFPGTIRKIFSKIARREDRGFARGIIRKKEKGSLEKFYNLLANFLMPSEILNTN